MRPAEAARTGDVDRRAISSMLMTLFDYWKFTPEEQLDALGLSTTHRAILAKYRRGEPISANRDTMERAGHLLVIHKNLRLLFPHSRDLAYAWMKTRNKAVATRGLSLTFAGDRIVPPDDMLKKSCRGPSHWRPPGTHRDKGDRGVR